MKKRLVGLLAGVLLFGSPQLGNGQETEGREKSSVSQEEDKQVKLRPYGSLPRVDLTYRFMSSLISYMNLKDLRTTIDCIHDTNFDASKQYEFGTPEKELQSGLFDAARRIHTLFGNDARNYDHIKPEEYGLILSTLDEVRRLFGNHKLNRRKAGHRGIGDYMEDISNTARNRGFTLPEEFKS